MAVSKSDEPVGERWDDLRYFLAVAAESSVKRAAISLGVTQSAVSKRIDSLERWIGGQVFERSPMGTVLTYQGERMLSNALQAQKHIALARQEARGAESRVEGDCSIVVADGIANFWIAQFMPHFLDRHPDIELKVILDQDIAVSRPDAFDLRIHYYDPKNPDHVTRLLATIHYMLFASKTYLKKHGTPRSPDDLRRHRAVDLAQYMSRAGSWTAWSGTEITKNVSIFTNQSSFFERCVHLGAGIAPIPTYLLLGNTELVPLPLEFNLTGKLYVSYSRVHAAKPAVRTMLNYLRETIFNTAHMPWFRHEFEAPSAEWELMHRAWISQA